MRVELALSLAVHDKGHYYVVVGEEEGTKPRKVLMTEEQFEQLLEEI